MMNHHSNATRTTNLKTRQQQAINNENERDQSNGLRRDALKVKTNTRASAPKTPKNKRMAVGMRRTSSSGSASSGSTTGSASASAATGPKSRSFPKTRKAELEWLRDERARLQTLLEQILHARKAKEQGASHWKLLATSEKLAASQIIQQNTKLRDTIHQQRELAKLIQKLCTKMGTQLQTIGTLQDNEWRLNVLSRHPQRRLRNADLILNHFYAKLPTQLITSGLVDSQELVQFSKCSNANLIDQIAYQEVNLSSAFTGHYTVLAEYLWRDKMNQIALNDHMYVQNELHEQFDERTSLWLGSTRFGQPEAEPEPNTYIWFPEPLPRRPPPPPTEPHQSQEPMNSSYCLLRRIDEQGCITIFFKAVRETESEIVDSLQIIENSAGWFALVDGGVDKDGMPITLLKCNMSAELMPITHRLEHFVGFANSMQLGSFPDPSGLDEQNRKQLDQQLRQLFTQVITEVLWKYVKRQKAATANHSRHAMMNHNHDMDSLEPQAIV